MTKLAYERPVMRAEVFRTNAYAEGCKRVVVGVDNLLKFVFNGVDLFFSDIRHDTINMITGQSEYYFKEAADYDKTPDDTYFLEYSAQRKNFHLYQDHANSGYGRNNDDTPQISGQGTLQTALNGWSSGQWTRTLNNPDGVSGNLDQRTQYFSDTVVKEKISFDAVQGAQMGMSY